jgi:hypothetical protein
LWCTLVGGSVYRILGLGDGSLTGSAPDDELMMIS